MASVYMPTGKAITDRVIVTAPDGTIHTTSMFKDYVVGGLLGPSQGSAELTNGLIQDAINWAGKTRLYGDKGLASKAIQRNFWNVNGMNFWSTFANSCDQYYRLGVLKLALADGEQLTQASKLARESLFDYGNVSQGERALIARVFWFWSFQRESFRSVSTSLLMDPRALKVAFAQGRGWSYVYDLTFGENPDAPDLRYSMKDYSESRPYLKLVEDEENQRRYAVYGPSIPQVQAVGTLIDYLSIPLAFSLNNDTPEAAVKSGVKAFGEVGDILTKGGNPAIQIVAAEWWGIDTKSGKDISGYLDPKFMYYVRKNEQVRKIFDTFVMTEPVPEEEEKPGAGYYQGNQWRIPPDDKRSQKNWLLIKALMLGVGVQRTLADYGPLAQQLSPPVTDPTLDNTPDLLLDTQNAETNFWRNLGVITAQDAPMIEEIQRANRYSTARDIQELSGTSVPIDQRYQTPESQKESE
jgi:hypothetical protein